MNKIAASVGLLALGASALHAAESSTLNSMQKTKAWSVQATLRGFYDDNISASSGLNKTDSFGFEINPSVDYGVAGEQTSFNLGYAFTARYFDKQAANRTDKSDYTHSFNADFAHAFSPRVDINANESFVIGQEPDLIGNTASTQPIDGDNIRNFAGAELNISATRLVSFSLGYNNALYDYAAQFNSAYYDRMEHSIRFDSRWVIQPETTGILGYTYLQNNYTESGFLPASAIAVDSRDTRGHRFYAGVEQIFNPTLSGSVRAGLEIYDYVNIPGSDSETSPYFEGSLRYQYQTATTFDVGGRYSRSAASGSSIFGGTSIVRDMETLSVYASIKHQLAQQLFISGNASVARSKFNAPGFVGVDGESYLSYALGLDLSYKVNENLSAHVGYNYDQLESDPLGRDFDRNRLYLGVTAGF